MQRTLGLTLVSLGLVWLGGCSGNKPAKADLPTALAVNPPAPTPEAPPTPKPNEADAARAAAPSASTATAAQTQGQPASPSVRFSYPADKGGQQLDKLLTPGLPRLAVQAQRRTQQPPRPTPLERPELGVPLVADTPLRLPMPPEAKRMPQPLNDAVLTIASEPVPSTPPPPRLAAAPPVRIDGPDLSKPAAMPNLARYQPDRASLADPTGDYSIESVLARDWPERVGPAPFDKLDLPEPNAGTGNLRLPASERDDPLLTLPRLPNRPAPR